MAGESFQIKGADGKQVSIPAGEYYFNSKARCRRMMLNSLSSDARRVYACLELGTMGFQQELAVVQIAKDKQRPLGPLDIREQTGLLRQNVRRGLEELEKAGLAQRVAVDGGPLQKGKVLLYSWAVPQKQAEKFGNRARLPNPAWIPTGSPAWKTLLTFARRHKIEVPEHLGSARGPLDTRAEELARELQNLKMEFARFWEGVCAQAKNPASNKEERTEITERTKASSSAFDVRDRATKADEEDLPSDYQTFKRLYPAAHFDEDKAKPAFQKLKKAERQQVIARLVELFLACERWLDEDGRYVPLASNWLNGKWSCDPPPALKKRSSKREDQEAEYARGREILRQAEEAERAAKGAGK